MNPRVWSTSRKPDAGGRGIMGGLSATLLVAAAALGCAAPAADPAVADAILAWIRCTECDEGQLDSLVTLGSTAVPGLRAVLLNGPDESDLAEFRISLGEDHDRLLARAADPQTQPRLPRDEYIEIHVSNVVARERLRAAYALTAIGGSEARAALEGVLLTTAREDVLGEVRALLDSW